MRNGPAPERPGRLDVLLLLDRQGLATDDPGDAGPGEERDHPQNHGEARAEHNREGQRQHHVGERKHRVHEPGQHRVDHPAEVAGDHADGDAGDRGDQRGDHSHEQGDPRAVEDSHQQVPAGAVGTQDEPVGPGADGQASRALSGVRVRGVGWVPGKCGERGRCDGQRHHDHDDDERDNGYFVAEEPAPGQLPLAAALDRLFRRALGALDFDGDRGDAHIADSWLPAAARFSPASTGKWQAVTCVAGSPALTSNCGSSSEHSGCALGQRG